MTCSKPESAKSLPEKKKTNEPAPEERRGKVGEGAAIFEPVAKRRTLPPGIGYG